MLSADEYQSLIAKIDNIGPEIAPVNTSQGTRGRTDVRNNEQVMFHDVKLAVQVFRTAEPHVPVEMRSRQLVGANGRFRCYRYKPGTRFALHADGSFERANDKSFYTFLIYLNDDFTGGETNMATQPELSFHSP